MTVKELKKLLEDVDDELELVGTVWPLAHQQV